MRSPANLPYLYPSIPNTVISRRWQEYHEEFVQALLEQLLRITEFYAIPSGELSATVKDKLETRRLRVGVHIYYLVKRSEIPHSLRERFRALSGTRLYRKEK